MKQTFFLSALVAALVGATGYKAGSSRQAVALPIAPDDPFYTVEGIRGAVPHFYEKTASVESQDGDLSFGNFRKGEK